MSNATDCNEGELMLGQRTLFSNPLSFRMATSKRTVQIFLLHPHFPPFKFLLLTTTNYPHYPFIIIFGIHNTSSISLEVTLHPFHPNYCLPIVPPLYMSSLETKNTNPSTSTSNAKSFSTHTLPPLCPPPIIYMNPSHAIQSLHAID